MIVWRNPNINANFEGIKETEVNEFMLLGLGLGVSILVMISVFLMCHRKRKRRRLEHPMLPSHAHFHTCESIGERFATSSSMDSVIIQALYHLKNLGKYISIPN